MPPLRKVIVLGLDGLEPKIVDALLARGELPNLAVLHSRGGYSRVASTYPAQTPVAWSTFATGTNPGGHGIFDFIGRDPNTYLPNLALNRYEQKNLFLPPRAVNRRRGTPVWQALSEAGVSSTILRCPCTYPPDTLRGRLLAGMGVPDICGGLGTSTFFTTDQKVHEQESEHVVHLKAEVEGELSTHLPGPRHPRTGACATFPFVLQMSGDRALLSCAGQPTQLILKPREWSSWLLIKFKMGLLQAVAGMVRFFLVRLQPEVELYASPINFAPNSPPFPISSPLGYAAELANSIGPYYTTGMVEDHNGLNNGRFGEDVFLDQCEQVVGERERMMLHELQRHSEGLFFCLFDTPDRIQHMFWRFRESDHPANRAAHQGGDRQNGGFSHVIDEHYRRCDSIVGKALEYGDDQTLVIVLSDHGFNSFQRGVHLNSWLFDNGFLALSGKLEPGPETAEFFHGVDWDRTRAFALGLAGIYLNLKGRERAGVVELEQAAGLKQELIDRLTGSTDSARGAIAIRSVVAREEIYSGPYAAESPDLIINFSPGYRVSWATALGGLPAGQFEDNVRKWSGDHIIDPSLVPGVLFMNRPFSGENARLVDLAPTILSALGVPKRPEMEGMSILR